MKIDWNLPLPEELVPEWKKNLFGLTKLKSVEMHGFSDASARAYPSCIYLKFILYDDNTLVKFSCSKTRVNPLERKFLMVPRLELMGFVLLSNLMKSCLEL